MEDSKKVDVTVSITLSKSFTIHTDNYQLEPNTDKEGNTFTDVVFDDLKLDVIEQIYLPSESENIVRQIYNGYLSSNIVKDKVLKDLSDWNVDDFTVIEE